MVVWFWFCSARQRHAQNLIEQKQRSAAPKAALARFLVPTFKAENNQAVGVHASTHPAAHRGEACFIIATIASCISIPHLRQGDLFKTPSICQGSRLILPRRSAKEPLRKRESPTALLHFQLRSSRHPEPKRSSFTSKGYRLVRSGSDRLKVVAIRVYAKLKV